MSLEAVLLPVVGGLVILLFVQHLLLRSVLDGAAAERARLQRMAFAESKPERIAAVMADRSAPASDITRPVAVPRRLEGV